MKRLALATASGTLLLCVSFPIVGANPFETRLSPDRQILQTLNRLTFGPRPGDVEEVRRIGLEKWIDLQLHPDRIPENPTLEKRLDPLETLRMDSATVVRDYLGPQQMMTMNQVTPLFQMLPQEELRKIQNGTAEERKAALDSLDPAKRKEVLSRLAPNVLADLPDYKKEADDARKEQATERQAEARKRNPQLADLLTPEQARIARSGDWEQLKALMDGLDPEKQLQVASALPPQQAAEFPDLRREGMRKRAPAQLPTSDRDAGKMLRAIYSNRQLEEVLVDFWFNHFNVYENKNPNGAVLSYSSLLTGYERDAIRPHVLGHFKDLLLAVAQHPVMLYYLDNWESMAADTEDRRDVGPFAPAIASVLIPNRPVANRQPHGLNENFGREIMELHTLGVNGGYTQKDVIEVARCFTGWTITKPQSPAFLFSEVMHDDGEKTVLGHRIPAGGGFKDGLTVIDILAHHPSTAHFISKQLAMRFVADDPPPALVERMAQTFLKTDGDLRAVLLTMFDSLEFRSEGAWDAKIKSPFEMVVSAVRATNADAIDTTVLTQRVSDLGEPLYRKVEPNGYPLTGDGWLGTSDLLGRLNFTSSLILGKVPGVKVDTARWDGKTPDEISRDLLARPAAPETLAVISPTAPPTAIAQLILGSPEFNKR